MVSVITSSSCCGDVSDDEGLTEGHEVDNTARSCLSRGSGILRSTGDRENGGRRMDGDV
jgi:hypothetical protein